MIVRAFRLAVHVALELVVVGEDEVPEVEELNSQFADAEARAAAGAGGVARGA